VAHRVIVDGNNLLFAMRDHAPLPPLGRETLVKLLDRWAGQAGVRVLVVFDGPMPKGGLAQQMSTRRVDVRFSAPKSADDIIAELLASAKSSWELRVISSDRALRKEASRRHSAHTDCVRFIEEVFSAIAPSHSSRPEASKPPVAKNLPASQSDADSEKPIDAGSAQTDEWLQWLGLNEDDPNEPPPHGIR